MTEGAKADELARLVSGAMEVGVELDVARADALLRFLDYFYSWNRYAGLTSIERQDAVRLHLLDSLSIAPELRGSKRVVDLGSGGGMPGIPLAIALPQTTFELVESKRRRCSFLREAIREMGLGRRVTVTEADARRLEHAQPAPDAIVARAFMPPPELLALCRRLLAPGGLLFILTGGGPEAPAALGNPGSGFELAGQRAFVLPGGPDRRSILCVRRLGDCFT